MDEKPGSREFDLREVIEVIDRERESPAQRAAKVMGILKQHEITNWDVLCFAAEYIGSMAATSLYWLKDPAAKILRLLYLAHYVKFEDVEWLTRDTLDKAGEH